MNVKEYLVKIFLHIEEVVRTTHYMCSVFPYRGLNWNFDHDVKDVIVQWMHQRIFRFEKQEQSGSYH